MLAVVDAGDPEDTETEGRPWGYVECIYYLGLQHFVSAFVQRGSMWLPVRKYGPSVGTFRHSINNLTKERVGISSLSRHGWDSRPTLRESGEREKEKRAKEKLDELLTDTASVRRIGSASM